MPSKRQPENSPLTNLRVTSLFLLLLVMTGWIYSHAFTGAYFYDDTPNLSGLADIETGLDRMHFITSGDAGPTGRPVSLATFVLQADAWPDEPERFLQFNTAIHLFNGLLVFLLAAQLGRIIRPDASHADWFALGVAACWMLSPFLISSTLLIIQRMTLLSATFVFGGCLLYIQGRILLEKSKNSGLALVVISILLGTLLATLAKENGALLPLFILLIEFLILKNRIPILDKRVRYLVNAVILVPSTILVSMLLARINVDSFIYRSFTLEERLLTQARILWNYIYNLLIPNQFSITPFQDDFVPSKGLVEPITTALSITGLIILVAVACFLRKIAPLLLFCIGWFFLGHLMESTFLPLELYYAHRNYVPAFGLFFILVYVLLFSEITKNHKRIASYFLASYIALSGIILLDVASLWGNPRVAAEIWYIQQPHSERAAQFLALTLGIQGDTISSNRVLRQASLRIPNSHNLKIQTLFPCTPENPEAYENDVKRVVGELKKHRGDFSLANASELNKLALRYHRNECQYPNPDHIIALLDALASDERYIKNRYSHQNIEYARAIMAYAQDRTDNTLEHLHKAYKIAPDKNIALVTASLMASYRQIDEAKIYLEDILNNLPVTGIEAMVWQRDLSGYLDQISNTNSIPFRESLSVGSRMNPKSASRQNTEYVMGMSSYQ